MFILIELDHMVDAMKLIGCWDVHVPWWTLFVQQESPSACGAALHKDPRIMAVLRALQYREIAAVPQSMCWRIKITQPNWRMTIIKHKKYVYIYTHIYACKYCTIQLYAKNQKGLARHMYPCCKHD